MPTSKRHKVAAAQSGNHVAAKTRSGKPPKRRPRKKAQSKGILLKEEAFDAVEKAVPAEDLIWTVEEVSRKLCDRVQTLQSTKGGAFFPSENVFSTRSPWIFGYLGLSVDEQHGEVRRQGYRWTVTFQVTSLEWQMFLAAWNRGEAGCSPPQWELRDQTLKVHGRIKVIRHKVNDKLKILAIRLEPRRPPRLVERLSARK